jgi:mRNA interferase RelE/StbE
MIYKVRFKDDALKEWNKLGYTIQCQFEKKLDKLRHHPRIPSAKLQAMPDCYKIKLRKEGYRLVYRVLDDVVIIEIIAIGRRDGAVYDDAKTRLN